MQVNFKQNVIPQSVSASVAPAVDLTAPPSVSAALPTESDSDKFQASSKDEGKKGPVQVVKDFVRAVKKFNITLSEYAKGTLKGIGQAALAGSAVFTVGSAINFAKKGKIAAKTAKRFHSGALAIATAVVTMGANYWKTSLEANNKKADVDHKYTPTKIFDHK